MGTIVVFAVIIVFFVLIVAILVLNHHYRNEIKKRDLQIEDLTGTVEELQDKLNSRQRRRAFRLQLFEEKCEFELIEFGDQVLERLKHRKGEGVLKDVSRSGLQFICQVDLPVRKEIFLKIRFTLKGEEFNLKGKIVRKEEHLQYIAYGIHFIDVNPLEEQRLVRVINQIELDKRIVED